MERPVYSYFIGQFFYLSTIYFHLIYQKKSLAALNNIINFVYFVNLKG